MATLKELARTCDFGHTPSGTTLTPQVILEENLRDRLVCGIAEPSIQCRLLGESNLSFDRALEIALAMESAATNTAQLHPTHNTSPSVNVQNLSRKPGESDKPVQHEQSIQKACFRCGKPRSPNGCRFKNTKCNFCHKVGHIESYCFAKKKSLAKKSKTHHVTPGTAAEEQTPQDFHTTGDDSDTGSTYELFTIASSRPDPIRYSIWWMESYCPWRLMREQHFQL